MEQYWRGRGWKFNEIAKELHKVKCKANKTNQTKLSLAITADCSIFPLPCQTKTLPVTASSSSPTFQFLSHSNVSQTARCTPSRGGRGSRAQRENERCKKPECNSFILQPHSGSLSLKSRPSQEKFQTSHFHSLSKTKHKTKQKPPTTT